MVRSQGSFTPEDEDSFRGVGVRHKDAEGYVPGEAESSALEDRIVDLDAVEQSPFLRGQKRVPVRRGPFQRGTANRLRAILLILAIAFAAAVAAAVVYRYGKNSARFRLDSSDSIEIIGAGNTTRAQVLQVMGADIGRNVFFIPLDERKRQLEKIPWVESAMVMRLLPNRLRIALRERTPIAFAKVGDRIALIDAERRNHGDASGRHLFVPGHRGQRRIRSAFDPRGADEDLPRTCPPVGFDRRELLA